jgi:CBS domain-containing protein
MKLEQIMTRNVEIVKADDPLEIAAQKMRDRDVGSLPVLDDGRLIGVITDRDITVRATAAGLDPRRTRVRNLITTDLIWCYPDQDVDKAAKLMEDYQIRRMIILDPESQKLVGIISLGDLAKKQDSEKVGEILEKVSEPAPAD